MVFNFLSTDEKQVFEMLQKKGPLTKKSLLTYFNYKPSTLNRIISSLLKNNLIVEFGQEESSGGRKPSLFDVNVNERTLLVLRYQEPILM